jgi:two-component system sensor histidine kinase CpxA
VVLTVADCGPGVPESELPKIFDPFYRLDSARTPASGGTGIGLTITKACIESCHGSISARNRVPNGLEVVIHLPAWLEEPKVIGAEQVATETA